MINLPNVALVLDIDGVIRDVSNSYRRALADTVEHFTNSGYRPTPEDIDVLKAEGIWNNDWEASQELIHRYFRQVNQPTEQISYKTIVEFFQSRYRGGDRNNWSGYICQEPLIATSEYFQSLTNTGIRWGFFSGATRGSASFVLNRLAIDSPVLVAMEDASGKPDPAGLLVVVDKLQEQLKDESLELVIYVGDTVADMLTVVKAREIETKYRWLAVGVIPPHVKSENRASYIEMLKSQGADLVLDTVLELTPEKIEQLTANCST